jgi:hypothetical protein
MNRFEPLMTYSSPWPTARVRTAAASDPASASVSANAIRLRPAATSGSQRCWLAGVARDHHGQGPQRLDGHDETRSGTYATNLLHDQSGVEEAASDATDVLGQRDPEQVMLGEEFLDVPRELGRSIDRRRSWGDELVGQRASRVAEEHLRRSQSVGSGQRARGAHRRSSEQAGRRPDRPAERQLRAWPQR